MRIVIDTVSVKWLKSAAASLMREADDSLDSWVLLGQTHRYDENQQRAALLMRAAGIKNVAERREFLRGHGFKA